MNGSVEFLKKTNKYLNMTKDPDIRLNLELLKAELQTFIEGFPFKGFYFPIKYDLKGMKVVKVNLYPNLHFLLFNSVTWKGFRTHFYHH